MKSTTIAVDLAKNVFQIAVSHQPGKVAEKHRLSRSEFLRFFAERTPALVLLESCGTSQFWARQLTTLGHEVLLLPPHAVRPYVRPGRKTDQADAKGLLEAHRNEEIHPVPVKSVSQQALAALHRLRSAWMTDRTGRLNQVRAILREFGIAVPKGAAHVIPRALAEASNPNSEVPIPLRQVLADTCQEIRDFETRIQSVEKQLRAVAAQTPVVKRLMSIPGIGLLTATALVAFVGSVQRFATSRHFSSFFGLTPREHSSGQIRRLGRISKCGDAYLRCLLINGARSALRAGKCCRQPDGLRTWALQVEQRCGHNRATVALANKIARIVWAVWRHDRPFEPRPVRVQAAAAA